MQLQKIILQIENNGKLITNQVFFVHQRELKFKLKKP